MTWVRKVPGVRNLPRWRMARPKTMLTLSGRPMSRLSRISCSKKIRPLTGRARAMVGELDLLDRQLPAVIGVLVGAGERLLQPGQPLAGQPVDRKSTRLNSSHGYISYAVFCLKKKT